MVATTPHLTNRVDYNPEQIVSLAKGRCNQENVIEQLKNGVNAMRMPVDDLLSNWAYMVVRRGKPEATRVKVPPVELDGLRPKEMSGMRPRGRSRKRGIH